MTATFKIQGDGVTLAQLLKAAGLADSGGHAGVLIAGGLVKVNGEVELRKRRQLAVGDVVELDQAETVKLV